MRHLPHSELKLRGVNAQQQNAHVQSPCTLQAKEFQALNPIKESPALHQYYLPLSINRNEYSKTFFIHKSSKINPDFKMIHKTDQISRRH